MNLISTEKVYEKNHPTFGLYYLHETETEDGTRRYITVWGPNGVSHPPGRTIDKNRVTYRITDDFEIEEVCKKPSLEVLTDRIRLVAQKLVDNKVLVETLEIECAHCGGDNFGKTFLVMAGARPLRVGCGDAPSYLAWFVTINDEGIITDVVQDISVMNVERVEDSYMDTLKAIEEWVK